MYYCGECKRAVVVTPEGKIIRACSHKDATVIAPRAAVMYGISSLQRMTEKERAERGL